MNYPKYHICAIIKDEHLFLREWIEYHLGIGFDHITLYEDFTSQSHSDITRDYPQVTLRSMRDVAACKEGQTGRQIACYHHFIQTLSPTLPLYGEGVAWCAFIDIDEFFRLEDGWTLDKLTEAYKDTAGLCLWWKCYGANGHVKRSHLPTSPKGEELFAAGGADLLVEKGEPGVDYYSPVQASYSDDLIPYDGYWQFKSFVNLTVANEFLPPGGGREVAFINCHYHRFISHLDGERADFRQNRNKKHIQYTPAWIDHYITKSWEDWEARLKRGNITKGIRDEEFFFRLNPSMRDKCKV